MMKNPLNWREIAALAAFAGMIALPALFAYLRFAV